MNPEYMTVLPNLIFAGMWLNLVGGLVYGPDTNEQDTSTPDKIVHQAYQFLQQNLVTGTHKPTGFHYSFSKPSSYKYSPSQWLWGAYGCLLSYTHILDSGAHQILWAQKDVDKAVSDLKGMLNFQLEDGRIPEVINWEAEKQGFVWQILTKIQYSRTTYNDLTQMPVLPYRSHVPRG